MTKLIIDSWKKHRHLGNLFIFLGILLTGYSIVFSPNIVSTEKEKVPLFDRNYILTTSILDLPNFTNPNLALDLSHRDLMGLMYDGLLVTRGLSSRLTPHLVSSWSFDPSSNTYELTIRPQIFFWDGDELTSKHVLDSFHQWLAPHAPFASQLINILGAFEYNAGQASAISGITASERYRLRIIFKKHDAFFLHMLAGDHFRIAKQQNGIFIGTGPFIPQSSLRHELILHRNDRYYNGIPALGGFHFIEMNYSEIDKAMSEHTIDLTWNDFTVPVINFDNFYKELPNLDYRPLLLYFNTRVPHFFSVDKRLAIFHAVDRNRIVSLCQLGNEAMTIIPPRHMGFDAQAKKIPFTKKNYPIWPETIQLIYVEDIGSPTACLVAQLNRSFSQANIPLVAKLLSPQQFRHLKENNKLLAGVELISFPPDNEIRPFLYFSRNSQTNYVGYNNDLHENLIQLTTQADSMEARATLLRELDYATQAYGYALPLCQIKEIYYIRKDIHVGNDSFFRRTPDWTKIGKIKS